MKNTNVLLMASLLLSLPASAEIVAVDGWARATVPGAAVAAGYATLRNTGDETRKLLRLTSPVADMITLHRSSVDANGMSRMWPVGSLELKAGEQLRLEPNGMHMMITELAAPLVVGTRVPVTFKFDGGEEPVTVQLEVRPLVPDAPKAMDHSKHEHH